MNIVKVLLSTYLCYEHCKCIVISNLCYEYCKGNVICQALQSMFMSDLKGLIKILKMHNAIVELFCTEHTSHQRLIRHLDLALFCYSI